jgi:hypothetical protein
MLNEKQIQAHVRSLEAKATGIVGQRIRVVPILRRDQLGYTDATMTIRLGYGHKIAKNLTVAETASFFYGIGLHEIMHLLLSDFKQLDQRIKRKKCPEDKIYHEICNILEDSAIEHFAPQYVGGRLIDDLNLARAQIYKQSEPIESINDPYGQFITAAIMIGDAGLLKGEFTYPEAKRIFTDTLPLWTAGVTEASPTRRFDLSEEIFVRSRPLWEGRYNDELDGQISEIMELSGKTIHETDLRTSGLGDRPDESEMPETERSKRRTMTILKLNADDEIGNDDAEPTTGSKAESQDDASSIEDESTLSEEEGEKIIEELEDYELKVEDEAKSDAEVDAQPINLPISSDGYKNVCKGIVANNEYSVSRESNEDIEQYDKLVASIQDSVNILSRQFARLFTKAKDEKQHRTSGKHNANRAARAKLSCRVYDKNREMGSNFDTAIFILVDESGSMRNKKIRQARLAVIGLAEALSASNIPLYIMGFSSDEMASKRPDHYHYVKWRNTAKDRHRLLNVAARCANNFDGYSIRSAHSILKRHPAQNKILIVISDGRPLCDAYGRTSGLGIADTIMAIREASKDATVVGLLIGDLDATAHKEMYGYNFMHVKKVDELFGQLGNYLRKTVKGW